MKKKFALAAAMLAGMSAGCAADSSRNKPQDDFACRYTVWEWHKECPGIAGDYLNGTTAMRRGEWPVAVEFFQSAVVNGAASAHPQQQLFRAALYAEKHDVLIRQAQKMTAGADKDAAALVILAAKKAKEGDTGAAIAKLAEVQVEDRTAMAEYVRYVREFLMADAILEGETPGDQFMRVMNDAMYQPSDMPGYPPDGIEPLIVFTGLYVLPSDPFIIARAADYHRMMDAPEKAVAFLERIPAHAEGYIFYQADIARILEDTGRADEAAARWGRIGAELQRRKDAGQMLDEQEDILYAYAQEVMRNGLTKSETKGKMEPSLKPQ